MAVDTQFIVVIEMRALSPVHSLLWSNCVLQRAAASLCDDGLMMVPKENASNEVVQSQTNVRSQHTRHRRRSGLAQAERLREGCRYSVPSRGPPPGIIS